MGKMFLFSASTESLQIFNASLSLHPFIMTSKTFLTSMFLQGGNSFGIMNNIQKILNTGNNFDNKTHQELTS